MINVLPLEIRGTVDQQDVQIFPVLLQIGNENFLVDCGYADTTVQLEQSLNSLGITSLSGVIITHDDHDHVGGLRYLKRQYRNLKVYCGKRESASISGKIKSERLLQFKASLPFLSWDQRSWALGMIQELEDLPRFPLDGEFNDFALFKEHVEIIYTPGHTQGHISLFYEKEKTLIAGDALVIQEGIFDIANPEFTLNLADAIKSVEKIRALRPEKVYCYHGGSMEIDVMSHLDALIDRYHTMEKVRGLK